MERLVERVTDMLYSRAVWLALACAFAAAVSGRALAEAPPHVFALVIASNRSLDASQPELQYADDDAARYYRLLRSVAGEEDVALLASFDRASKLLYGELASVSRAASTAELVRARDRLARNIEAARLRGERSTLYIVYAGHAELVEGRGMLELEDRRIDGAFIEHELLEQLPADDKHVILDSCNSFFVMNPRKPGGRRWATPDDIALGFAARHPEVGLFLSTNSESEVFEWSELESGVFSHEVRSGMSGAADVDQNGTVSYLELAGFVDKANAGIAREALRPHLFFRGPHGNQDAPLFSASAMRGRRVELGAAPTRLWIKDASGERVLDLHKEAGPLQVVIPERAQKPLTLYVQNGRQSDGVMVSELLADEGDTPLRLEDLTPRTPALAARGSRLFGELFREPYGPSAFTQYRATRDDAPRAVYGLSSDDVGRMHQYLREFASYGRAQRALGSTLMLSYAALSGSAAIALATFDDRGDRAEQIILTSGLSLGFLTVGLISALRPSNGERALASFERELKLGPAHGARAFAESEAWLERLATRERRVRRFWLWSTQFIAGTLLTAGIVRLTPAVSMSNDDRALSSALLFSGAAMVSALGLMVGLCESPAEHMLKLYRDDRRVQLGLSPVAGRKALGLGLSGAF
jgi:Caspase domain